MSDECPVVADNKPQIVEVEPGTYYWCACGLSNKQPYCDGSHAGTGMGPKVFTIEEKKKVAFCLCKKTKKSPFCDGSHKGL